MTNFARLTAVACLAVAASVSALEETSAHSVLKHELIETIVFHEKVNRVVDLFGGTIVYRDDRGVEIGSAGRIIMNGHVASYFVNDRQYTQERATCTVSSLPDQQQTVAVQATKVDMPFSKDDPNVFVTAVQEYLSRLPSLGRGETQIVIIDPYFYMPEVVVQRLLAATDASTKFLIYSPRDRVTERRFPTRDCKAQVYSEVDDSFRILTNKDRNPLTYTVAGCRIGSWNAAVADALKVFSATSRQERNGAVLIKASQTPQDFHQYLDGAENIRKCVVEGVDSFH